VLYVAQAVSRRVRARVRRFWICGGQSGTVRVPLPLIPPTAAHRPVAASVPCHAKQKAGRVIVISFNGEDCAGPLHHNLVLFCLVSCGGARLSPLGTSATVWPIVPPLNGRQ
jgi:hypothetical protein